jgi:glycine cleavage system H protein
MIPGRFFFSAAIGFRIRMNAFAGGVCRIAVSKDAPNLLFNAFSRRNFMNTPKNLKYTKDHEWARLEGGSALVGITDYAQEKLGSIVFAELPPAGKVFQKGQTVVTIDSVKAVAEVFAPLSGEIEAVNQALQDTPEAINKDPYGEGWIFKMKAADPAEISQLLSPEAYEAFVAEEEAKG